jgi:DNA-binding IclR family transcriptional regulator
MVADAGGTSLSELLPRAGLPKSSLLRILGSLVDEGYLDRPSHGNYRPGLKLWRLGCQAIDYDYVRANVLDLLRDLVAQTSESAHYAVYDHGRSAYVEKVDGSNPIQAYTSVGSSSPAYATATGKALLAWQSEDEIRRVLASAETHSSLTITDIDEFLESARAARELGYTVNRGEWRPGVGGIAAPVWDRHGVVIAAIGISGPVERIVAAVDEYAPIVVKTAATLSARLGYSNTDSGRRP